MCDVSKERHESFVKQLEEMKVCLQNHISDIRKLLESEVEIFSKNYSKLHMKIDVIDQALTCLIEDISSFNKDYTIGIQDIVKEDVQVFTRVEEFLSEIKTMILAQLTITPESISQMVSNIETNIKAGLDPIRRLLI
ncbi:unnamed protein product [Lactuca virosa]|uniref:Uncharacterized protein n=1 Tax=Lactuca virosa TaxID=75947 RepID=A0AAU9PQQ3_9ASTR|nr:unnamed protein product [Lactuca virosa]